MSYKPVSERRRCTKDEFYAVFIGLGGAILFVIVVALFIGLWRWVFSPQIKYSDARPAAVTTEILYSPPTTRVD